MNKKEIIKELAEVKKREKELIEEFVEIKKRELEQYEEREKAAGISNFTFPMADARFLWNVNKHGLITDIEVLCFAKGRVEEWPVHLYKLYSFDMGNSELNWEWYATLPWLLLIFFHDYGFANKDIENKFLIDLASVTEFRKELIPYILSRLAKD